ncbi:MAG: nitrogen regulation protein NR(II) [Propionivibrio sp.]|jgi:two-component system nitrogen regulation sensor histidine kinase GlnL
MSKPSRKNSPSSAESAAPATAATATGAPFAGLDLLSSSVLVLDAGLKIRYINSAAENLLAVSSRSAVGALLGEIVEASASLHEALDQALAHNWGYTGQGVEVRRLDGVALQLNCTVNPVEAAVEANGGARLLLELWPIDQQLRATREERLLEQQLASRELIRNLAHEIKNPLGGIRGAAQLLERELNNPALHEYTQVIVKETDRLQDLMKRLLSPHRPMQPGPVNIHEILERVRSLLNAEFPQTLSVVRDYDTSLPELIGDREQLIQAVLNIARNAAQAIGGMREPPAGGGRIVLRTRAARQVTLAKRRYRLALELQVVDNGPGIPEAIRERMFFPLVSGRDGGSGLGLTLAQSFVQQHQGTIECDSRPGWTCFTIHLPLELLSP